MLERMPYIFFYVADLARARKFYEEMLGLPVAETDSSSVKYDCGAVLLALNVISAPTATDRHVSLMFKVDDIKQKRRQLESFGVATADLDGYAIDGACTFTDLDGHRLGVYEPADPGASDSASSNVLTATEVSLSVPDLAAAHAHYEQKLGLAAVGHGHDPERDVRRFRIGDILLSVRAGSTRPDQSAPRSASYVFHVDDCERESLLLRDRGVEVAAARASVIGVTARFLDPGGNDFFLYEPSREALSWPSGPIYRRIVEKQGAA